MDQKPSLSRRNSFTHAQESADKKRANQDRRERYNAWILHRSRDKRTDKQQKIIDEFYQTLQAFLTTLFTGIHAVAGGAVTPASDNGIIGLLQSCLQFIPHVGSLLNTVAQTVTDSQRQEQMKRISVLLGNFTQMDELGEDFAAQMTAYHQRELTHPSGETSRVATLFAPLSDAIKKVTDFILGKKDLPHAQQHRELLELIVAEFMLGLVQASALSDLPKNLADYLSAQQKNISHQELHPLVPWSDDKTTRWHNSYHALRLSFLAYEHKSKIEELAQHFGFTQQTGQYHYFLTEKDIRCFIFANEQQISCTFRGTNTITNAVINLDFTSYKFSEGYQVHRGFYMALAPIWEQLNQIFTEHQSSFPNATLLFTGHSLGGALATLAGARWLEQHPGDAQRLQVITFGQPRIFKQHALSQEVEKCFHRFVNIGDPVPLLPTESALNYRHIGQAYYFPEAEQSFSWTANLNNSGKTMSQHSLVNYLPALVTHAKNAQIHLVIDQDQLAFQQYEDQISYQLALYQRLDIPDTVPAINLPATMISHPQLPTPELAQLITSLQAQIACEDLNAINETTQQFQRYFQSVPTISFPYTRAVELENLLWDKKYSELSVNTQHAIIHAYYQCLLQGLFSQGGRGYQPKNINWESQLAAYRPLKTTADTAALVFTHLKLMSLLKLLVRQYAEPHSYLVQGLVTLQTLVQGEASDSQVRLHTIEKCNKQLNAAELPDDFAQVLLFDILATQTSIDLVLLTWARQYISSHRDSRLSTILLGSALNLWLRALTYFDAAVRHELLFGAEELVGLRFWLEKSYLLSNSAEEWVLAGMLQNGLQFAAKTTSDPLLQALNTSPIEQALNQVINDVTLDVNLRLSLLLRLYCLQQEKHSQNKQLTLEEQEKLGTMAFAAKQYELAKYAYSKAHTLSRISDNTQISSTTSGLAKTIASIIEQQLQNLSHNQTWERTQAALEILYYVPDHSSAIQILFTLGVGPQLDVIKQRLLLLGTAITEQEKNSALQSGKVVWTGAFSDSYVLSDATVAQLFDGKHIRVHNRDDKQEQEGRHRVACIGAGEQCLHVKENPGHTGLAFSAWALAVWMFYETKVQGHLLVPVEPVLIERHYQGKLQQIIVQASPTIMGENLRKVFKTAGDSTPEILNHLDKQNFSALASVSMLLDMEDARPANWIVERANNQIRLVSIDNDHVWVNDEINDQNKLMVKNIVYCLDNMSQPIDANVRTALLDRSFSHTNRMKAWLYNLQYYNERIIKVFGQELLKTLHERKQEEKKVILEAYSHPEALGRLYFKWFLLRRSLEENNILDHWTLFKAIQPRLASIYKNAKGAQPKERFDNLTKELFTRKGGTQTTTSQLTEMILGKVAKDYASFAQARTTPESLLQLLGDLQSNVMLDFIERDVLHGNLSLFRDIPQAHQHQEALLLLFSGQKFKPGVYTSEFHKEFLAALSNDLTVLTFKDNAFLKDEELVLLIKRMPKLERITLDACSRITGYVPGVLGRHSWLSKFCKRGVKEIKLKACESLNPDLLGTLPAIWQAFPQVGWDIQPPRTWDIVTVVDLAMTYPEKGIPIPTAKYLQGEALRKVTEVKKLTIKYSSTINVLTVLHNGWLAGGAKAIKIWEINSQGTQLLHTIQGHSNHVRALTVLPNGWVAGAEDNTIKIWEVNSQAAKLLHTVQGHSNVIHDLAVLPNGWLASSSSDHTIKIWEINAQEPKLLHTIPERMVWSLTVLPNGWLASGSMDSGLQGADGSIKIWEVNTQGTQLLHTIQGHTDLVWALIVLPNGWLAGAGGKAIKIWEVNAKGSKLLHTIQGHSDIVYSLTVLPNGWLASGSDDNTIKIWEVNAQGTQLLHTIQGHADALFSLTVLPNGWLASGSTDNTIKIWPLCGHALDDRLTNASKTIRLLHNTRELLISNRLRLEQVPLLLTKEVAKDLTTLDVSNTRITDALLEAILGCCPRLVDIKYDHCGWLTEKGIALITARKQALSSASNNINNLYAYHTYSDTMSNVNPSSATASASSSTKTNTQNYQT
ncbi:MAG: hypothetical protein WC748_09450 [Legionellales bacterium]|jgi:WD40 repeat protein